MADIELQKVQNIESLARGFNYEGTVNIKDDVPTGGVCAVKFNSAELVGVIGKAAIVVEEHVPDTSSSGSTYTGYTVIMGDDGDTDGLIASVQLEATATPATLGTIFVNTGDDGIGSTVDNVDITFTSAGEADEALATAGKLKVLMEYYPTAGDNYSG